MATGTSNLKRNISYLLSTKEFTITATTDAYRSDGGDYVDGSVNVNNYSGYTPIGIHSYYANQAQWCFPILEVRSGKLYYRIKSYKSSKITNGILKVTILYRKND